MLSGYEISGFALGLTAMFEISNEALYVRYDESSRKMEILYRLGRDERMRRMRKEERIDLLEKRKNGKVSKRQQSRYIILCPYDPNPISLCHSIPPFRTT